MMLRVSVSSLLFAAWLLPGQGTSSQAPSYRLKVAVDEVELTFHAIDAHGLPVNDLKLEELRILDNGRPPHRTVLFQALRDLPIRAGILIDTSSSMESSRTRDEAIAATYTQHILEQKTDQAFVLSFNRHLQMQQTWTNDPSRLTAAIGHAGNLPATTALFDTLYSACRYQFGALNHGTTGNFILLFSDGDDDASFLPLESTVTMCQQTNTAIYVFHSESESGSGSGSHVLFQLAALTGGRVFPDTESAADFNEDLLLIQQNLRNQYRLVYNPADLLRDGAFHRVVLLPPDRVASINARSGYYAPKH